MSTITIIGGSSAGVVAEWQTAIVDEATGIAEKKFNELAESGHAIFEGKGGTAVAEGPVRTFDPNAQEYLAVRGFQGG